MPIHNILSSHKTKFFTSDSMELRVIFLSRAVLEFKGKSLKSP